MLDISKSVYFNGGPPCFLAPRTVRVPECHKARDDGGDSTRCIRRHARTSAAGSASKGRDTHAHGHDARSVNAVSTGNRFARDEHPSTRCLESCVAGTGSWVSIKSGVFATGTFLPPLKTLQLYCKYPVGVDQVVRSVESRHLQTLERLCIDAADFSGKSGPWPQLDFRTRSGSALPMRELEVPLPMLLDQWTSLSSLRYLGVLRFIDCRGPFVDGYAQQDDTAPLAALLLLEELSFGLSKAATDYRALRCMTNLRVLQMTDGWIRDFIDCTLHLEILHCDTLHWDPLYSPPFKELTFEKRANSRNEPPRLPLLCEVDLRFPGSRESEVYLNEYAFQLLEQASTVAVAQRLVSPEAMRRISRLPKLESLEVEECVEQGLSAQDAVYRDSRPSHDRCDRTLELNSREP